MCVLKEHTKHSFTFDASFSDGKRKLFVTMFIKNVTLADDSLYGALGRNECHAFVVGDAVPSGKHGFSVSVITSTTCKLFLHYFLAICDFLAMRETQSRWKCISPFDQY